MTSGNYTYQLPANAADHENAMGADSHCKQFIIDQLKELSKAEVATHLAALSDNIVYYPHVFNAYSKGFELLAKQRQAYCWLLDTEDRLQLYLTSVRKLLTYTLRDFGQVKVDLLQFMDLSRPPVLYMHSGVLNSYAELVAKLIASPYCTEELCSNLKINQFVKALAASGHCAPLPRRGTAKK